MTGGDWNCALNFTLDGLGAEPNFLLSSYLDNTVADSLLVDVWRLQNPLSRCINGLELWVGP